MIRRLLIASLFGLIPLFSLQADEEEGFVSLFNGKNLDGWVNVNGHPSTWSVRDGVIYCTGEPIAMLRSEKQYQNFIIELEWRHLKSGGNSGLFVWSGPMPAVGTPFYKGIEVQILDGREGDWFTSQGDIFPTWGAKMKPVNGRENFNNMRAYPTAERTKPSPEWNHYRVTCQDGEISLAVNGEVVTRGLECNPRKGYLALESEGSPIEFKNIRIKELPATDIADDLVADQAEGFESIFSGLDLEGWKTDNQDHWIAKSGIILHEGGRGQGGDPNIWTEKEYKNFEMIVDWRWPYNKEQLAEVPTRARPIILPDGSHKKDDDGKEITVDVPDLDSGIYLRGSSKSQINMWTWTVGSGEVYGYRMDQKMPAEVRAGVTPSENADKPIGQWNRFHITMKDDLLTVVLNGKTVLDKAKLPGVPASGPLALQHHGCKVEFRNLFIKSLDD